MDVVSWEMEKWNRGIVGIIVFYQQSMDSYISIRLTFSPLAVWCLPVCVCVCVFHLFFALLQVHWWRMQLLDSYRCAALAWHSRICPCSFVSSVQGGLLQVHTWKYGVSKVSASQFLSPRRLSALRLWEKLLPCWRRPRLHGLYS